MSESEFSDRIKKEMQALHGYAFYLTKEEDDAWDLTQETLARAFRYRKRYKVDYSFKSWLFKVMKNCFLNEKRKRRVINETIDIDQFHYHQTNYAVQNLGEQHLSMEAIENEIATMESKFKEPFLLFNRGFRYDEIAKRMHIPLGTVKNRIHKARKFLQNNPAVFAVSNG